MTKKIELKDADTLDSLLERKEQIDTAIAELAYSFREKLHRLEAATSKSHTSGGQQMQKADEQSKVESSDSFNFGTSWLWNAAVFIAMLIFIWAAMALLKESKANGDVQPVQIQSIGYTVEPVSTEQPTEIAEKTPPTVVAVPEVIQRQRIRPFQRRI
jgi:hypothetical protein